MKKSLLDFLACPRCRAGLELSVFSEVPCAELEVMEGMMVCRSCSKSYPVIDGIPRFVPNALENHPDFLKKYPRAGEPRSETAFKAVHGSTQERFSFEWMRYPGSLPEDLPFLAETQIMPEDWRGKTVLDAGCGMGRYSRVAHQLGAAVIAMDLGTALVRLWDVAKASSRLHIIQGDLTAPPIKENSLDTVYSIGVIHHTPSAKDTFRQLTRLVKPGGRLSVWVYGCARAYSDFKTNPLREDRASLKKMLPLVWAVNKIREGLSDALRLFTVHVPHRPLYAFCYLLAGAGKIPFVKYLTFSVHPDWRVRLQENFDWLTPPYQSHHTKEELVQWYKDAGFEVLSVLPHGFVPKPGVLGRKKR